MGQFRDITKEITEKQKTCPHPPKEIVFLADNITVCHHCYGLLDENLKLVEEEKSAKRTSGMNFVI